MVISKQWAMPNKYTFNIKPIKKLLLKYIKNAVTIIDPFANNSTVGTIRNDINPDMNTEYHLDALTFLRAMQTDSADVVLFDPPYSLRQATEHYNRYGSERLKGGVANMRYWSKCKSECARITKPGGLCISFGWNSNGIGMKRGFEPVEILIVSHGGGKNDTLVTVERKQPPKITPETMTLFC